MPPRLPNYQTLGLWKWWDPAVQIEEPDGTSHSHPFTPTIIYHMIQVNHQPFGMPVTMVEFSERLPGDGALPVATHRYANTNDFSRVPGGRMHLRYIRPLVAGSYADFLLRSKSISAFTVVSGYHQVYQIWSTMINIDQYLLEVLWQCYSSVTPAILLHMNELCAFILPKLGMIV